MFKSLFSNQISNRKLDNIEKETKNAFFKVRKEFEDHLEAINENTNEIQSNYELLLKLENKIDKLDNTMAQINRFIDQFKAQQLYFIDETQASSFTILPLREEEKKTFRTMYELEAEGEKVTYSKLSDVLGISTSLAREYVSGLIEKGVPIVKSYRHQKVFLSFESKFKELQTKKGIVDL